MVLATENTGSLYFVFAISGLATSVPDLAVSFLRVALWTPQSKIDQGDAKPY
jgi:hypothetical protein